MRTDPPLRLLEDIGPDGRPVRRTLPMRLVQWLANPLTAFLVLVGLSVLVLAVLGLRWLYLPSVPTTDPSKVEAIEVRLRESKGNTPPETHQDKAEVVTTDPDVIRVFLGAFRTAERAEEHHCGNSGTVLIYHKDGTFEEFAILPGHDEAYYEYRLAGRINRVDREPFLAALRAMGLQNVKRMGP